MALGLRELKKERTRNLIVEVVTALIYERGYHEITIEEICTRCEITAPTFYKYYASKEDVLGHIYTELTYQFAASAADRLDADVSFEERLRTLTSDIAEGAVSNGVLWKTLMLWGDNTRTPESKMMEAASKYNDTLTRLFQAGQESGELRGDQPARTLAAIFDGAIYMLGFRWACGWVADEELETAFHQAIDICLRGMGPSGV